MATATHNRVPLAIAVLALSGAVLTGCSLLGSAPAPTSTIPPTPEPTISAVIGVYTLAVGDCMNPGAAGAAVTDVLKVECSVPHDSEAFARIVMTDAAFPGAQVVADKANAGCASEFKTFVGVDYSKSALSFNYYFPTEASWPKGDREILCLVFDKKGKTTGTLKGAAR
jgi:hypothetical protein